MTGTYDSEYGFTKQDMNYLISPSLGNNLLDRNLSQEVCVKSYRSKTAKIHHGHDIMNSQEQTRVEIDKHHSKPEIPKDLEDRDNPAPPWITVSRKQNIKRKVEIFTDMKIQSTLRPKRKKVENPQQIKDERTSQRKKKINQVEENECFKWGMSSLKS